MSPIFNDKDVVTINSAIKITMANQKVINIPAHTQGVVENAGPDAITFCCNPVTTAFPIKFAIAKDDPELNKISLGSSKNKPKPFYDADMPGYLRDDEGYLMEDDERKVSYLLYRRSYWTPWQIEVHFHPGHLKLKDGVSGVFRTTRSDGHECEQFSLITSDDLPEYCYAQVQIFESGDVTTFSYVPSEIRIDPKKKCITISILAHLEWKQGQLVIYPIEE